MRIVLTESLEGAMAEEVWAMYEQSYRHMETLSVDPQVRQHDEFLTMLADTRFLKYLAQDNGGAVRGLIAVTRHLDAVSWINAKYFAARWPEKSAEGRIYYVWIVIMHPDHRGQGGFKRLMEPVAQLASRENAMLAFDVCAYNDANVNVFVRALNTGVEFTGQEFVGHTLDRLTFYAITLGRDDDDTDAFDGRVINLDAEGADSGLPNR